MWHFLFFIIPEVVLLHQTIIKKWLMFYWKILTPTFILTLFLLNLRKISDPTFILTPTFIRHQRVFKMMISLGNFFHFLKILMFWAKIGVKEQKWPKIGKKLVSTLSEEQHVIWLRILAGFWFLLFLVCFRQFFLLRKF